jgi:hypothetical protein
MSNSATVRTSAHEHASPYNELLHACVRLSTAGQSLKETCTVETTQSTHSFMVFSMLVLFSLGLVPWNCVFKLCSF